MKIAASLMCADSMHIMRNVMALVKVGVDYFHMDIMDGNFVNNLALNLEVIRESRRLTRIPFDVHLMVQEPSKYFDQLVECEIDIIIFHVETNEDIQKNIEYLKKKNVKVGLAMNIETPPSFVEKYLPHIDYLLLMNVKTGFSGLKFCDELYEKTNYLYSYIKKNNLNVELISDGGVKLEHIKPLYESGIDIVVAGTSMLFNNNGFSNNLHKFKEITSNLPERKMIDVEKSYETEYNAAVLRDINDFEIEKKKQKSLKEDEVIVKVMSCGICGSDIDRVYKNGMYSKNLVPGHEFSGIVLKTNQDNDHLMNQRVAVFPLIPCKKCDYCKSEKYNLCDNYNYLGSRCDGGFAEQVVVPKDNLVPIPNNVTYDQASLLEPLAVVHRGVKKLTDVANADVLILGLGPIGVIAGMLCKHFGANMIAGIDRNQHKMIIAKQAGFDEAWTPDINVNNRTFHILIDCSGASELINMNIHNIKKEGSILFLGNHQNDLCLEPRTMSKILRSELKIYSSWNSNISDPFKNDWKVCMNLMSKNEIDVNPLITHRYQLKEIVEAFDKIKDKKISCLKVLIHPN